MNCPDCGKELESTDMYSGDPTAPDLYCTQCQAEYQLRLSFQEDQSLVRIS